MPSTLAKRLDALERRVAPVETCELVLRGGLGGLDRGMDRATAGAWAWDRGQGEAFEAFRARVWAEVRADGGNVVVFGGLPDEFDGGARDA